MSVKGSTECPYPYLFNLLAIEGSAGVAIVICAERSIAVNEKKVFREAISACFCPAYLSFQVVSSPRTDDDIELGFSILTRNTDPSRHQT